MSTCISRHGEYGSHELTGVGADRFVCQWCGVLDEDGMLAALADAESAVAAGSARIAAVEAAEAELRTQVARYAEALANMRFSKYRNAEDWAWLNAEGIGRRLAVLAASPTPTGPEPATKPKWVRDPACVEQWPECYDGDYNPACCRFPKSCSCLIPATPEPTEETP